MLVALEQRSEKIFHLILYFNYLIMKNVKTIIIYKSNYYTARSNRQKYEKIVIRYFLIIIFRLQLLMHRVKLFKIHMLKYN
ncbi:hypothetical protein RIR_jg11582.t1 [Rhizophagus irregularis DAOM 181602=DAOM 197198]|nr:hypothetical protein RIR_jg11582.t1 [Rhizophagus irregularis DAOM 181602=DAOM 197198]